MASLTRPLRSALWIFSLGAGASIFLWWLGRRRRIVDPCLAGAVSQSERIHDEEESFSACAPAADGELSEDLANRELKCRQKLPLVTAPSPESGMFAGLHSCREVISLLNKAASGLELCKNRSEKDRHRLELLESVLARLRILETDLVQIIHDGNCGGQLMEDTLGSNFSRHRVRTSTLSVLSDDSFMSAVDEWQIMSDDYGPPIDRCDVPRENLKFLQEGFDAAISSQVSFRKDRSTFCKCTSEIEFQAKLFCLRDAFQRITDDERKCMWLINSGRNLLGQLMKICNRDPTNFYKAYDDMTLFFEIADNRFLAEVELRERNVSQLGLWDVVFDFILLDAFDDLKNPPPTVYSVMQNTWVSDSLKYSTICTIIWSMLKAKRKRLANNNGFIARFYNISEAVSPSITLGFLGTQEKQSELCRYFKEQVSQFIIECFDEGRVRFTSREDLFEDVWLLLENRVEDLLTRFSNELTSC